jgi:hypothetical protein
LGQDKVVKVNDKVVVFRRVSGENKGELGVLLFDKRAFIRVGDGAKVFDLRQNVSQNSLRNQDFGSCRIENGSFSSGRCKRFIVVDLRKSVNSQNPLVCGRTPDDGESNQVVRQIILLLTEKYFVYDRVEQERKRLGLGSELRAQS